MTQEEKLKAALKELLETWDDFCDGGILAEREVYAEWTDPMRELIK